MWSNPMLLNLDLSSDSMLKLLSLEPFKNLVDSQHRVKMSPGDLSLIFVVKPLHLVRQDATRLLDFSNANVKINVYERMFDQLCNLVQLADLSQLTVKPIITWSLTTCFSAVDCAAKTAWVHQVNRMLEASKV